MKNIVVLLAVILMGSFLSAQVVLTMNITKAAEEKFDITFPNAKMVTWGKEGTNYEADFKLDETSMSAEFTPEGVYVCKKMKMEVPALPQVTMDYLIRNYSGRPASNAVMITQADGKINYEVKVEENELTFDETGKYISMKRK
jgi:hypothetical protein